MGQGLAGGPALPTDAAVDIASFLFSTQARAVFCVARLEASQTDAAYVELATRCCGSDGGTPSRPSRSRAQVAADKARHAVEAGGGSARAAFWAAQRHVCEVCFSRGSCVRKKCQECRQRRQEGGPPLPKRGLDMCCQCAARYVLTESVQRELEKINRAAEAWASRCVGPGDIEVRPPPDFGFDFAGLFCIKEVFLIAKEGFWQSVTGARDLRTNEPMFFWAAAGRVSREVLGRCERSGLLYNFEPQQGVDFNRFLHLCYADIRDARQEWRTVDLGNEVEFFKVEERIIYKVVRAVTLLAKLDRYDARRVMLAVFGTLRKTAKTPKLANPMLWVDATSLVLCGETVSSPATHVPTKLLNRVGRAIFQSIGPSALHRATESAAKLLRFAERDPVAAGPAAAALAASPTLRGDSKGCSFAELWCGEPEVASDLARFCRHRAKRLHAQPLGCERLVVESVGLLEGRLSNRGPTGRTNRFGWYRGKAAAEAAEEFLGEEDPEASDASMEAARAAPAAKKVRTAEEEAKNRKFLAHRAMSRVMLGKNNIPQERDQRRVLNAASLLQGGIE